MMHAIRPILLYLAKRYRNEDIEDLLANPSLLKYARTCMVAAQRSLLVLMALQKQNIIGSLFVLDICLIQSPRSPYSLRCLRILRPGCSIFVGLRYGALEDDWLR